MNAEKLKELRTKKILTQKELAEEAGVSLRTVGALEAGETTAHPSTIRKLAGVLGVDPVELIGAPS